MSSHYVDRCLHCKSLEHNSIDCASRIDLIDFTEDSVQNSPQETQTIHQDVLRQDLPGYHHEQNFTTAGSIQGHQAASSISSIEAKLSTNEDQVSDGELTTPSSVETEEEDQQFLADMQLAYDLSLKETNSKPSVGVPQSTEPSFKILRLVDPEKKDLSMSTWLERRQSPLTLSGSSVLEPERASISQVDLNRMIPIEVKKASEQVPTSSFLALGEGIQAKKKKKRGKSGSKVESYPVVRTYNQESDTVNVSKIPKKRDGGAKGLSYYNVTSELQYLR